MCDHISFISSSGVFVAVNLIRNSQVTVEHNSTWALNLLGCSVYLHWFKHLNLGSELLRLNDGVPGPEEQKKLSTLRNIGTEIYNLP